MKTKPLFTGIAGGIKDIQNSTVEDLFGRSGLNTGNFLFVKALRETLGDHEAIYESNINHDSMRQSTFDYIAVSAANWINPSIELGDLADIIEKTNLPCLIVGLGAQLDFGKTALSLTKGTERFLKVASERSKYISVRGATTQEALEKFGVYNTWVTGCPSLLGSSATARHIPDKIKITNPKMVVLQGTRHRYSEAIFSGDQLSKFNLDIYRYAMQNSHPLLIQSELPDMYYIMARTNNESINRKNSEYLERIYKEEEPQINQYLKHHGLLFWNLDDWFNELSQYEALIGTRIHGVISAILAGIPAVLLTHDERTRELAETMCLPHRDIRELETFTGATIENVLSEACFSRFNSNMTNYIENFRDFFNANEVRTTL